MAWKCANCGAHGEPNQKGVIGFVLLHGCINCTKIKLPKMCKKCGCGPCMCRDKGLGKSLKEFRLAKGYTLREVESKCNISNPYLCQVENERVKDISFSKLVTLCKLYEIDIKYFEQFILTPKHG